MAKVFDKILIVMLENALRSQVLANDYMKDLRKKGVFLENSFGVTHSSQPNYIASIGGDTFGLFDDTPGYAHWIYETGPKVPAVTTIVDLLEAKGLTWKAYAEGLRDTNKTDTNKTDAHKYLTPPPPRDVPHVIVQAPFPPIPGDTFPFARKHVPFLSFPSITSVPERLANIVDAKQFTDDLKAENLPHYSWYTPNLINDGHSLSETKQRIDATKDRRNIDNIETFLKSFLSDDPIAKFPPKTLIVVTFDEAYPYHDPYQIYTLLIGDMLKDEAGTSRCEPYNHYSLLRTVEENFGVGTLKRNDAVATPYWFLQG